MMIRESYGLREFIVNAGQHFSADKIATLALLERTNHYQADAARLVLDGWAELIIKEFQLASQSYKNRKKTDAPPIRFVPSAQADPSQAEPSSESTSDIHHNKGPLSGGSNQEDPLSQPLSESPQSERHPSGSSTDHTGSVDSSQDLSIAPVVNGHTPGHRPLNDNPQPVSKEGA